MKKTEKTTFQKYRSRLLLTIFTVLLCYNYIVPYAFFLFYQPKEGDIIFQSLPNASDLVKAIEGVSDSPYSHCGIILKKDNKWFVNEAIMDVHSTPLLSFIARGRGKRFAIYRLTEQYQHHVKSVITELDKYQGKPYDFRYRLEDAEIYCSELIYNAYKDATNQNLGVCKKLGDLNWKPYKETILEHEGKQTIPLERLMITPIELSKAEQLEKVYSYGL